MTAELTIDVYGASLAELHREARRRASAFFGSTPFVIGAFHVTARRASLDGAPALYVGSVVIRAEQVDDEHTTTLEERGRIHRRGLPARLAR